MLPSWSISQLYKIDVFVHTDVQTRGRSGHTQSLGFRNASSISASRVPLAGSCMYSHLRMTSDSVTTRRGQPAVDTSEVQTVLWRGSSLPCGEWEGHEDALDSWAGRGQAKLHSPVVHQVKLHIPAEQHILTVGSKLPVHCLRWSGAVWKHIRTNQGSPCSGFTFTGIIL